MWSIDTYWFDTALVSAIYALGNILLGHFEIKSSRLRKTMKYLISLLLILAVSYLFGKLAVIITLGTLLLPVFYIHLYDLPKKGVNGWTGEPKDRYYKIRGWTLDDNFEEINKSNNA